MTTESRRRGNWRPGYRWAVAFLATWLLALGGIARLIALPGPAAASPTGALVVTTTADGGPGSLRQAINMANSSPDGDIITFDLPADSTITLGGSQLPPITGTLAIDGSDSANLTISGDFASRILEIDSGATVTLIRVTLTRGDASDGDGCPSFCGGTIYSQGELNVISATVRFSDAGSGGGIYNDGGTLTIDDSAIYGNQAPFGGGIYNNGGDVSITNSSLSGNETATDDKFPIFRFGGGIYSDGTLTIANSTLNDNSASFLGGGIFNNSDGTLHMTNSIIANSPFGGDCASPGAVETNVNNLIEDGSCGAALSGDPLLGPFQDNGGPTLSHALLAGSPAIDAGDQMACPPADQRGEARPQDGDGDGTAICDIGAFEVPDIQVGPAFTVTDMGDAGEGHCGVVSCTLREAIAATNRRMGADAISFDLADNSVILLGGNQLPMISDTLTIDGGTAAGLAISGDNASRILEIGAGANFTMTALSLINGNSSAGGGAVLNNGGVYTITNSTFHDNSADGSGGAINNIGGMVTIRDSSFISNTASSFGGGIHSSGGMVTVENSHFGDNSTDHGGAIYSSSPGALLVDQSDFTGNTASGDGGAINVVENAEIVNSSFISNTAARGGGIYNDDGAVAVHGSTLAGNAADDGDEATDDFGGGIYNYQGTVNVANSSISGNRATTNGGGIFSDGATLFVYHSTISGNSSGSAGGGLVVGGGTLHLRNSLIANSPSGGDCVDDGSIETNEYNLIEDGSCTENAIGLIAEAPLLGPLADNGGPTLTHALMPGSPAIDAGESLICGTEPVSGLDQRGLSRPVDGDGDGVAVCDIGAFEWRQLIVALPVIVNPAGP